MTKFFFFFFVSFSFLVIPSCPGEGLLPKAAWMPAAIWYGLERKAEKRPKKNRKKKRKRRESSADDRWGAKSLGSYPVSGTG